MSRDIASLRSYDDCRRVWVGRKKSLDYRRLANNTTLHFHEGTASFFIRLHSTDIIRYSFNGYITLRTGGWNTCTTRDRIDRFSPCSLITRGEHLYVSYDGGLTMFHDGVTVHPNAPLPTFTQDYHLHYKLAGWISDYAVALVDARLRQRIPYPSQNDACWFCAMTDEAGVPLGDAMGAHQHLLDHVVNGDLAPSLLRNAARAEDEFATPGTAVRAVFDYIAHRTGTMQGIPVRRKRKP